MLSFLAMSSIWAGGEYFEFLIPFQYINQDQFPDRDMIGSELNTALMRSASKTWI